MAPVVALAGTLFSLLALFPAAAPSRAVEAQESQTAADSVAVARTVESFHAALAAGDSAAALALLAPDVVVLEGGAVENLEHYRSGHLPADIRFAQAVARERGELHVRIQGDVAWAASTTSSRGEMRGRSVDSRGAELMVLSRGREGWVIRAVHWSSRSGG